MKKILKILSLILIFVIMLSNLSSATSIKSLNDRKKEIGNKIKKQKAMINSINKEKDSVTREISNLDSQLEIANLELQEIATDLEKLEIDIKNTVETLETTEEKLTNNMDKFAERVNHMYKTPDYSYLEVLLNSDSLQDYLTRKQIMTSIAEQDNDLIQEIKEEKTSIEQNKNLLTKQKDYTEKRRYDLTTKKNEIVAATREKELYMQKLDENQKELEAGLNRFNKEANDLTAKIKALQSSNTKYTGGKLNWPVPVSRSISSGYGNRIHPILKKKMFHSGIDIPAPTGAPIVAASSGRVIYSDWYASYGKVVMIDHGGGIVTLYGHCSSLNVSVGQQVSRGQNIASIGSTGRSTGPHLHFEVRKDGKFENPISWVGR